MDLGAITMEGFVCSENGKSSDVSNPETNTQKKSHGSGFLKPERSVSGEDNWVVGNKIARTDDYFTVPNPKTTTMLHQKGVNLPGSDSVSTADGGQYMLCFSSPKAEVPFLSSNGGDRTTQSNSFSFYQQPPAYSRNSGYGSLMNGARGPFTPSQWMELEHQALIYKFISANAPVPPSLLIPIKKALNAFMYSGMSNSGSYTPNSYGWGSFHLGFAGGTDPEPGRCRRTDGKKWRCARDAVPDQKYCERHLNRGRHRSRKPVEGQTGRSAAATTTTTTTNVVVPPPPIPSSSIATNSTSSEPHGLSMISPAMELKPKDPSFSDFGLVFSDTFLNPTPKTSYMNSGTSNSFLGFNNQEQKPDGPKSDWTQLSMSIPISSPPPPEERVNLSPLRLSQEYDPIEMGLGQKSWVPISWGNSMGGPLGEVLNSTGGGAAVAGSKKLSPLMMSEEWHLSQYQLGTSPTGVLQKTFVSLSNSSSGSSPPRGAALEAASLSYDVMQ